MKSLEAPLPLQQKVYLYHHEKNYILPQTENLVKTCLRILEIKVQVFEPSDELKQARKQKEHFVSLQSIKASV